MKKLAFILVIAFASCTLEPIAPQNSNYTYTNINDCGTLLLIGQDSGVSWIVVKMNDSNQAKYQVADYKFYINQMGKQVCGLSTLQQLPY